MNTSTQRLAGLAVMVTLAATACSPGQTAETGAPARMPSGSAPETEPFKPEPIVEEEPQPEPEPEPEGPVIAQVGDTLEVSEWDEPLGSITISDFQTSNRPHDDYGEGPTHGVFVIFSVTVEAAASFEVYDGDFYVVAQDGTRYDLGDGNSYDAIDYDDALDWVELNAGEKKSGLLAFDLPTEHGQLAYAPNYESGPIGVWEF
jgi:hypothetical protein